MASRKEILVPTTGHLCSLLLSLWGSCWGGYKVCRGFGLCAETFVDNRPVSVWFETIKILFLAMSQKGDCSVPLAPLSQRQGCNLSYLPKLSRVPRERTVRWCQFESNCVSWIKRNPLEVERLSPLSSIFQLLCLAPSFPVGSPTGCSDYL